MAVRLNDLLGCVTYPPGRSPTDCAGGLTPELHWLCPVGAEHCAVDDGAKALSSSAACTALAKQAGPSAGGATVELTFRLLVRVPGAPPAKR